MFSSVGAVLALAVLATGGLGEKSCLSASVVDASTCAFEACASYAETIQCKSDLEACRLSLAQQSCSGGGGGGSNMSVLKLENAETGEKRLFSTLTPYSAYDDLIAEVMSKFGFTDTEKIHIRFTWNDGGDVHVDVQDDGDLQTVFAYGQATGEISKVIATDLATPEPTPSPTASPSPSPTDVPTGSPIEGMEFLNCADAKESGVYTNVQGVDVYCDVDTEEAGEGWTLLMKIGSELDEMFDYDSEHWTTYSVLNEGDLNLDDGYAKFDAFNSEVMMEFMAVFPDFQEGDKTWRVSPEQPMTAREFFSETERVLSYGNGNIVTVEHWNAAYWSIQTPAQTYGTNLDLCDNHAKVRWGFVFNENGADDFCSSDAAGGIGFAVRDTKRCSACDWYGCCGTQAASPGYEGGRTGGMRAYRALIYGRPMAQTTCQRLMDLGKPSGTYNINGSDIYCNNDLEEGGWTLLMKTDGTEGGDIFNYASEHWTDSSSTVGTDSVDLSPGNSKFDAFNNQAFSEYMLVWPDFESGDNTWIVQTEDGNPVLPIEFFSTTWVINYGTEEVNEGTIEHWNPEYWSTQTPARMYGINLNAGSSGRGQVRWGFAFNENGSDDFNSVDVAGGLGYQNCGSCDWYSCCGEKAPAPGVERQGTDAHYRAHLYGRAAVPKPYDPEASCTGKSSGVHTIGGAEAYCSDLGEGGWELIMKSGDSGATLTYDSDLWTSDNVLNDSADNMNMDNGDAKFGSFNTKKFTKFMAYFPQFQSGEKMWVVETQEAEPTTALEFFQTEWQIAYGVGEVNAIPHTNSDYWSTQTPAAMYGINLNNCNNASGVRWGFIYNENGADDFCSSDAIGGIGLFRSSYTCSTCDWYGCCGTGATSPGVGRDGRFGRYQALIFGKE